MKNRRFLFVFFAAMLMLVGCSKVEDDEPVRGVRCVLDLGGINLEGLSVMSSVGGYSYADSPDATLEICDTNAPQTVLVFDNHDNIRAMYRGILEEGEHVVINAHSSAFALIACHPTLALYADGQLSNLEQSLAADPAFAEVERQVSLSLAAERDLFDTTNTELRAACDTVFAHIFGRDSAEVEAKADDPLSFVNHAPLIAERIGGCLYLRNIGLCPTFYGTVTSCGGETTELVVPSREDYTLGSIAFQNLLLQNDIRYGDRVLVPTNLYNNNVELTNWNSPQAKTSVCLGFLNDILRILGVPFSNSAKAQLATSISSVVDNAVSRCVSGSDNYVMSVAVATGKGVWELVKTKGSELIIQSALGTTKKEWAKKMLEFGAGKMVAWYGAGIGTANFAMRLYYLIRYPNDVSFCMRIDYPEDNYSEPEWGECTEANLEVRYGDQQSGDAHEWLDNPLWAKVTDCAGDAVSDMTVRFTVEQGGGTLSNQTVVSDDQGVAETRWKLGEPGQQVCRAVVIDPATDEEISNAVFFTATATAPSGDGLFSVSAGRQVRFAPGNLEYSGGYHFATHQYDYGGYFGWGTGSNPTLTSTDYHDYPSFDDWGSHIGGGWRTLSLNEWNYVIWYRANASNKCGAATVCGVHGMVLLPDNWSGGTFHAGFNGWSTNVYDASSWPAMEDAGAVFLPAAGFRYGTEMDYVGAGGYYWSSAPNYEIGAYYMFFNGSHVYYYGNYYRYDGLSVRLVQDY